MTETKALQLKPLLESEAFARELMDKSKEEQLSAFAEHGVEVTEEELRDLTRRLCAAEGELGEADLESVTGGFGTLIVVYCCVMIGAVILLIIALKRFFG